MKIRSKWKENKGITTADIAIAIIVLVMFVSLITNAFYNYYISTAGKNRSAIATNCAIDVIEQVKKMQYDEIDTQSIQTLVKQMKTTGITVLEGSNIYIPEPYTISTTLEKYNETTGNTNKKDVIKKLTIKVEYMVGKKIQSIEMSKLITK